MGFTSGVNHASNPRVLTGERIVITSFLDGLNNKQLAASITVVKVQTTAKAERLAAKGYAVGLDQKSKKSSENYFLTYTSRYTKSQDKEYLNLGEEKTKELMATFADLNARHGNL